MRLTVLGSGTCELRAERAGPAYLLETQEFGLLLDLGHGAWRRLMDSGRDPAGVRAVLLSHQHPDHLADLMPFLFALNHDPRMAALEGLTLAAHPGLIAWLDQVRAPFGAWLSPPPQRLEQKGLAAGGEIFLGPLRVSAAPVDHSPFSLAYRLETAGASLVYLGDGPASPELAAFCAGADLVVAHAAGGDDRPKPGHMHPRAAGRLADEARAGALLLSHFYRDVDPAAAAASAGAVFGGPVWAARDLMSLSISPGLAEILVRS